MDSITVLLKVKLERLLHRLLTFIYKVTVSVYIIVLRLTVAAKQEYYNVAIGQCITYVY